MSAKLTHEIFLERANKAHDNKYTYPEEYVGFDNKILIVCPKHGEFKQSAGLHMRGAGCKKCAFLKTHEDFLKEANKTHNHKYEYPEEYAGTDYKIKIICPKHGDFQQNAYAHMSGNGCPLCAREYTANFFKGSFEEFVKNANIKHNNKYTYAGEYKNSHTKIEIICPYHGAFMQSPLHHLHAGNGCPKCAKNNKKDHNWFVEKSNMVHDFKYKYIGIYSNIKTHIEIECPDHGSFMQDPDSHVKGSGCPKCSHRSSKPENNWLDSLNIPQEYRQLKIKINNKTIKPDAFDASTKTIYEFYGDFWHGNPKVYKSNDINKATKTSFGELYQKTMDREKLIKTAGYNLITIWETNWKALNKA